MADSDILSKYGVKQDASSDSDILSKYGVKTKEDLSTPVEAGLMQAGNTFGVAPKISAVLGTGQDLIEKGKIPSLEDISSTYSINKDLANEVFDTAKKENPKASMAGGLINDALVGATAGKAIQGLINTPLVKQMASKLGETAESVAEKMITREPYSGQKNGILLSPTAAEQVEEPALDILRQNILDKAKSGASKALKYGVGYKAIKGLIGH